MRVQDPELKANIISSAINLLSEHDPAEIGMRTIADACGVTAAALYSYYPDKTALFEEVKLVCLAELKSYLVKTVKKTDTSIEQLKTVLESFASWCFKHPQKALLVMSKLQANTSASGDELKSYYECNAFGQAILEHAVADGYAVSDDPRFDTSIAVSALWGVIESILLKRADPIYWKQGKKCTDRFIKQYLLSLVHNEK